MQHFAITPQTIRCDLDDLIEESNIQGHHGATLFIALGIMLEAVAHAWLEYKFARGHQSSQRIDAAYRQGSLLPNVG